MDKEMKLFGSVRGLAKRIFRRNNNPDRRIREFLKFMSLSYPATGLTVLDVGARGGLEAAKGHYDCLRELKNLRLIGIEPDSAECRRLVEDFGYSHTVDIAAGRKRETRAYYVTRNPGCSSMYPPNDEINRDTIRFEYYALSEKIEILTVPIVACVDERVDFFKADLQGGAYDALLGAEALLKGAVAVVIDGYFDEVYKGQPLFCESHSFLYGLGFRLANVHAGNKHGFVRQGDFLYMRDPSSLNSKDDAIRIIMICAIFAHWHFIEYLLCRSSLHQFFSEKEVGLILSAGLVQKKIKLGAGDHRYKNEFGK